MFMQETIYSERVFGLLFLNRIKSKPCVIVSVAKEEEDQSLHI